MVTFKAPKNVSLCYHGWPAQDEVSPGQNPTNVYNASNIKCQSLVTFKKKLKYSCWLRQGSKAAQHVIASPKALRVLMKYGYPTCWADARSYREQMALASPQDLFLSPQRLQKNTSSVCVNTTHLLKWWFLKCLWLTSWVRLASWSPSKIPDVGIPRNTSRGWGKTKGTLRAIYAVTWGHVSSSSLAYPHD